MINNICGIGMTRCACRLDVAAQNAKTQTNECQHIGCVLEFFYHLNTVMAPETE